MLLLQGRPPILQSGFLLISGVIVHIPSTLPQQFLQQLSLVSPLLSLLQYLYLQVLVFVYRLCYLTGNRNAGEAGGGGRCRYRQTRQRIHIPSFWVPKCCSTVIGDVVQVHPVPLTGAVPSTTPFELVIVTVAPATPVIVGWSLVGIWVGNSRDCCSKPG